MGAADLGVLVFLALGSSWEALEAFLLAEGAAFAALVAFLGGMLAGGIRCVTRRISNLAIEGDALERGSRGRNCSRERIMERDVGVWWKERRDTRPKFSRP